MDEKKGRAVQTSRRKAVVKATAMTAALLIGIAIGRYARPPAQVEKPVADTAPPTPASTVEIVEPEAAEPTPSEEEPAYDNDTLLALARTVWGEARGCSATEQAAVIWCILNRVDSPDFPDTIMGVITQKNQFFGYDPENPVWPEILALAGDVLNRWELEQTAVGDVGRVLPREYTFFTGDGQHNNFRNEYRGGTTWDWSLSSPYGS